MTSEEDRRDLARHHTGPSGELGIDGAARTTDALEQAARAEPYGLADRLDIFASTAPSFYANLLHVAAAHLRILDAAVREADALREAASWALGFIETLPSHYFELPGDEEGRDKLRAALSPDEPAERERLASPGMTKAERDAYDLGYKAGMARVHDDAALRALDAQPEPAAGEREP